MQNKNVYNDFFQAMFFSGVAAVPALFLDNYNELGLNHREAMFIIHLLQEEGGKKELRWEEFRCKMGVTDKEMKDLSESLSQKGYLQFSASGSKGGFSCDLSGLLDQLFEVWGIQQYKSRDDSGEKKDVQPSAEPGELTAIFEGELGRPLTALECEHIEKWLTSFSKELIVEALRRGVGAGVRTFRYWDSILREWEKKGVKTLHEVEADDLEYQKRQQKKERKKGERRPSGENKNKYDDLYL